MNYSEDHVKKLYPICFCLDSLRCSSLSKNATGYVEHMQNSIGWMAKSRWCDGSPLCWEQLQNVDVIDRLNIFIDIASKILQLSWKLFFKKSGTLLSFCRPITTPSTINVPWKIGGFFCRKNSSQKNSFILNSRYFHIFI